MRVVGLVFVLEFVRNHFLAAPVPPDLLLQPNCRRLQHDCGRLHGNCARLQWDDYVHKSRCSQTRSPASPRVLWKRKCCFKRAQQNKTKTVTFSCLVCLWVTIALTIARRLQMPTYLEICSTKRQTDFRFASVVKFYTTLCGRISYLIQFSVFLPLFENSWSLNPTYVSSSKVVK